MTPRFYDEYRPETPDEVKAEINRWLARLNPNDQYFIPERMWGGLLRYLIVGVPPGDFLAAVIRNDLKDAVGRADDENVRLLAEYVRIFYNYTPRQAWGSKENMDSWISTGGLAGYFMEQMTDAEN